MQPLHTALAGLAAWPRFFVWRLEDWNGKKFKEKYPWDGAGRFDPKVACLTGRLHSYESAMALLGQLRARGDAVYSLGWYVMPDAGYWFLDLDGDVQWHGGVAMGAAGPQVTPGVMPTLSAIATEALQRVPTGCFGEYSSSMQGLHFIGRGALPAHKVKGKGMPPSVELYSRERGICFGLSGFAWGSADVEGIPPFVVEQTESDALLGDGRMPEWRGPEDDDALIELMLGRKDATQRLMGKATLRDLWEGDISKYAGASEADGALASHLAWWTGCDVERMTRLMWRSGLVRDKWSDPHHRTYVQITVDSACKELLGRGVRSCYVQREALQVALPVLPVVAAVEVPPPSSEWLRDAAEYRGVPGAMALITKAGNSDELKAIGVRVAAMQAWDAADLEVISQKLRRKSKELIGDGWPIALCRGMVAGKTKEAGSEGGVPDWLEDWAFVNNQNKYCHIPSNFGLMSREAVQVTLWNKPEIPVKATGMKEDVAAMLSMWNINVVNNMGYKPGAPLTYVQEGQVLLNKFHNSMPDQEYGWDLGAVQIYLEHVWNIANHNKEHYETLLQWLAHVVQRPGKLIRWAVLIIGAHGNGKTMFSAPLVKALGSRNVQLASSKGINNKGGFMDWVASEQCLGLVNDFSLAGPNKFENNEAVKPVISDDRVTITRKGKVEITYDNYANYIMSTNVREPVVIAETERRWFVLSTAWLDKLVKGDKAVSEAYFARLEAAIAALTPGQWRSWFESLPVPDKMPQRAPVTSTMLAIISNSTNEAQQALNECCGDWDVVTSNKLTDCLRGIEGAPSGKAIMRTMNDMGFDYYAERRATIHGKKCGVYVRSGSALSGWDAIRNEAMRFNADADSKVFAVPAFTVPSE